MDKKGNLVGAEGVHGAPVWASSDETVATVTAAADGLSAVVKGNAPGSGRVTATADADLGEGVKPIIGTLELTVTAGAASVVEITAGPPEEQADVPPVEPPVDPNVPTERRRR